MTLEQARKALDKFFGYKHFRPMQAEIIQAVYDRRDVVVLMPTGGGKSICYQVPALTMDGTVLVVSPLISLMRDQVEALRANGIPAAFLNSSLSANEQRQVEEDLFQGRLRLLYVSPERLVSQEFLPMLKSAPISLFAIDEAHCISAWGHDFRPEYGQLRFLKKQFPEVPVMALTATADKITRRDIVRQLGLQQPEVFVASFDRPNLSLEVRPGQKRREQILRFIRERRGESGIIYCQSRKATEELAATLALTGLRVDYYHAGRTTEERSRVQDAFIRDELDVVVATVAFGMGIDKSNVRWVVHYNMPQNIESYYQEIGRAGRDGAPADTLLFFSYRDVTVWKDILADSAPEIRDIRLAKLERMVQYATSAICRRKILLNYFGEQRTDNCGNCDVCLNPPRYFDGTVLAQKALSAVARLREQVDMTTLIDVLRGAGKSYLRKRGYDQIRTFGAGRDLSFYDWRHYLEQMLQLGLVEIAYDDHNRVCLTEAAWDVLKGRRKVELVQPATLKEREQAAKKHRTTAADLDHESAELFERLRQLRLEQARARGIAPYLVFSDATLRDMARTRPATLADMAQVSGVGEKKLAEYGRIFLDAIHLWAKEKGIALQVRRGGQTAVRIPATQKPDTLERTWELYNQGLTIEEMARARNLATSTIVTHLAKLYEEGRKVDLRRFVSRSEMQRVLEVLRTIEPPWRIREIHEALGGEIDYDKIKLAMAWVARKQRTR